MEASKVLTFSQVTIQDLKDRFGITVESEAFIPFVEPATLPDWLTTYLNINQLSPVIAKSEKAVSEMLIAPVLSAVKANNADRVSLFSGEPLANGELSGICDFVIAANPKAFLPEPPIMVLVEAKKQDIYGGIGQCIAEMLAAQYINQKLKVGSEVVFGCVTTGTEWLFIQLKAQRATTHPTLYYFTDLPRIISIFQWMIIQFFEKN
jgi:hypothetical protein